MSFNIHLRNVDTVLMNQLKHQAAQRQISMNTLVLDLLKQGLGLKAGRQSLVYHDLDQYAGTWSNQEAKAFLENISDFETIDKDLWK